MAVIASVNIANEIDARAPVPLHLDGAGREQWEFQCGGCPFTRYEPTGSAISNTPFDAVVRHVCPEGLVNVMVPESGALIPGLGPPITRNVPRTCAVPAREQDVPARTKTTAVAMATTRGCTRVILPDRQVCRADRPDARDCPFWVLLRAGRSAVIHGEGKKQSVHLLSVSESFPRCT
jgi:hypothetical protein